MDIDNHLRPIYWLRQTWQLILADTTTGYVCKACPIYSVLTSQNTVQLKLNLINLNSLSMRFTLQTNKDSFTNSRMWEVIWFQWEIERKTKNSVVADIYHRYKWWKLHSTSYFTLNCTVFQRIEICKTKRVIFLTYKGSKCLQYLSFLITRYHSLLSWTLKLE